VGKCGGVEGRTHILPVLSSPPPHTHTHTHTQVVFVATSGASPCIKVYPAVLALAKNFAGFASFARMMDEGGELITMLQELNVIEVGWSGRGVLLSSRRFQRRSSRRNRPTGEILTVLGRGGRRVFLCA
jgi:hypothetical protein